MQKRKKSSETRFEVLEFIRRYYLTYRHSPTLQEIADELGITRQSVHEHVIRLQQEGKIARCFRRARSIEIVEPNIILDL